LRYSSNTPDPFNLRNTVTIEPFSIAKPTGKFIQPATDAMLKERHALSVPRLVAFQVWSLFVLFKRPADAHITRLPFPAIGRSFKNCDYRAHG